MLCKILKKDIVKHNAEDVYDISVEKYHNFILENGAVVHNCDTFQSYDLMQQLQAEGFTCSLLSVDRVDTDHICKPYQAFKSALYENRFKLYNSKRLIDEITDLERNINTGKVDHPPNGHKDVCDSTCGAMFSCSKYAEEFAYDYGESYEVMNAVTDSNKEFDKKQITVDFEEELKKAFGAEENKDIFKDFGQGKATNDYTITSLKDGIVVF